MGGWDVCASDGVLRRRPSVAIGDIISVFMAVKCERALWIKNRTFLFRGKMVIVLHFG